MKTSWLRATGMVLAALLIMGTAMLFALAEDAYSLRVENGGGSGKHATGAVVELSADDAPQGQVFYRWSAAEGMFDDAYNPKARFTMPAADVTVTASYTTKSRVAISGVSVLGKDYDGQPVLPEGVPAPGADAQIDAAAYVYAYYSADGGGYAAAEPPKNAGAYRLIVTIADENATYFGTSGDIPFTIAPAALGIRPAAGQQRYIGMENPAFAYDVSGAAADETPCLTGALGGAADSGAAAGKYAVTLGTLACANGGAFLAANYRLTLLDAVTYSVVPYETDAAAVVSDDSLGDNGVHKGDITLIAPEDFLIALSQTGAEYAASVVVPAFSGEIVQHYYLKTNFGAVTDVKYITLRCDAGEPEVCLYSPSKNAAVAADQKILFAADESVSGVTGKTVTIRLGDSAYTADAGKGRLVGGDADGVWYIGYDLSHFSPTLTLLPGSTYTVSAEEGAFIDISGNASAEITEGTFTTAKAAGGKLVVFTLDGSAVIKDSAGNAIVSGQAVPAGTTLLFPSEFGDGKTISWKTYKDGQEVTDLDLSAYVVDGTLEAYATIAKAPLRGTAEITGMPCFGETLTAALNNGEQGLALCYTWLSGETIVQAGISSTYVVGAMDIGAVIQVEISCPERSGKVTAVTEIIQKAPFAGETPKPPAIAARTTNSVTLAAADGMEYRLGDGAWQDSPVFGGLGKGQSYRFYQRVKESATTLASESSDYAEAYTYGDLTGTITLSGKAQVGSPITASLAVTNNEGQLNWRWLRGETVVGNAAVYTPVAADVGQVLRVEVTSTAQGGTITAVTAPIAIGDYTGETPAPPVAAAVTGTTVTLVTTEGYEYSRDGVTWQSSGEFTQLTPGTAYLFYQRVRQNDTHAASPSSGPLSVTTMPALTGTVSVSGEPRYGKVLVASFNQNNNTGALTYTWLRGAMAVGTGTTYVVQATDIGNQLSVVVTSTVQYGSVTRIVGTVGKAEYAGDTPEAPTRLSRTANSVTLTPISGYEYSRDGKTWQDSNKFTGLKADTAYKFYQRVKASAFIEASPSSEAVSIRTAADSAGGDNAGGNNDDDTGGTDAVTALYSLTLSSGNTRVLSTTMTSLIKGNQTQDVTIKLENASFTFFKGTMQALPGVLWYDFGVLINGCIHEQAARAAAGDAYVGTIHYHYEGKLPASANIRLWIGAQHAGKTLYYYAIDTRTRELAYIQAAVVDTEGWVTVVQDHCSDYVFCDREILSAAPSPEPAAETPEPTAAPSPAPNPVKPRGSITGWQITLIIALGALLIIGGIWLYIRNRD